MAIELARFERGAPFAGDVTAALAAERERLGRLQLAQIVHGRRMIVAIDGWEGSGRRDLLKAICSGLDPIFAHAQALPGLRDESEPHWLAPFWARLPSAGHTSLFLRSWSERAVLARVAGRLTAKQWARSSDEINEFENAQAEHGTKIVKIFLHATAATQARRLEGRASDPWQRWRLRDDDLAELEKRDSQQAAWTTLLHETDTRWAPWTVIDGNDQQAALIAGCRAVADAMERAMPAEPPSDATNVVILNRTA